MDLSETQSTISSFGSASSELVELRFSATGLADMDMLTQSDPFAVVFAEHFGVGMEEVMRTETLIDELHPRWVRTLVFRYHASAPPSRMVVDIFDRDARASSLNKHDFLGRGTFTVAKILATNTRTFVTELRDAQEYRHKPFAKAIKGKLRIEAETLRPCAVPERTVDICILSSSLRTRGMLKRNVVQFFEIWRQRGNGWAVVYRSEDGLAVHEDGYVHFDKACITERTLHNMHRQRTLRVVFFARNTRKAHDVISYGELTADRLFQKCAPVELLADDASGAQGELYIEGVQGMFLDSHIVRLVADHYLNKRYSTTIPGEHNKSRLMRSPPSFISLH